MNQELLVEKSDSLGDFIEELKSKNIVISFSAGKLLYSGPDENITPEVLAKLKKFKGKLIKSIWPAELGNLMPIQPEGSKIPLFVVHGDNGNYILSEFLGPDQPLYGFFHPGSEGEKIRYRNVKQMAKSYLEKVKYICPNGPYYLIGYSFGGNLAFEMALQLQKSGFKVPFLVLLDPECLWIKEKIVWEENLFKTIKINFLRPLRRRLKHFIFLIMCELYALRNVPLPINKRTYYMWIKYSKLSKNYKPDKFNGSILLFRATETTPIERALVWKDYAESVTLIDLACKHLEIFSNKDRSTIINTEIEKHLLNV